LKTERWGSPLVQEKYQGEKACDKRHPYRIIIIIIIIMMRLRMILKSELNAKNKITAIGALAVPVLRYSFGIINCRIEEITKIDTKTRKILTMYKMHHPKADIDRLYVKRK
jgi:hypothetical protein